jgi:YHS domain-containing protein
MKHLVLFFFIGITPFLFSQQEYNTQNGFIANGYDVVEYFNNNPEKGNKNFSTSFNGVKLKFSNKENLAIFKKSPKKYMPQYGGYCAYAIGKNAEKVTINPKTFEIRNGKLYLFYNSWGTNTLKLWNKEGAENLQKKADQNWKKLLIGN